jgi:hypothetical protein
VTIEGCNFLQRDRGVILRDDDGGDHGDRDDDHAADDNHNGDGGSATVGSRCCEVRVLLNNEVVCPSVVRSDTSIAAYIPPVAEEGTYLVVVELTMSWSHGSSSSSSSSSSDGDGDGDDGGDSGKHIRVRSDLCGVGKSWINLKQRSFPRMMSLATKPDSCCKIITSHTMICAPTKPLAVRSTYSDDIHDDDTQSYNNHSTNNDDTREVDEEEEEEEEEEKALMMKMEASEHRKRSSEEIVHVVSASKPFKRLRRIHVIDSDTDDGDADGIYDTHHGDDDDDEMHRCTSILIPTSGIMTETVSTINPPIAADEYNDASSSSLSIELQSIYNDLLSVMSSSLQRLINCSLSEPFLQPVTDLIAPSYRSIVSHPMDIGTIEESISEGLYVKTIVIHSSSSSDVAADDGNHDDGDGNDEASRTVAQQYELPDLQAFIDDVRLVWSNCLLFNGVTSPLTRAAYLLSYLFEDTWREKLSTLPHHLSGGGGGMLLSIKMTSKLTSSRDVDGDGGIVVEDSDDDDDDDDRNHNSGNDKDHHGKDGNIIASSNCLISFMNKGIARITPCLVFTGTVCSSLRRSLPPSKVTTLLANSCMVSSSSSSDHHSPVFASADEALAPYVVTMSREGERDRQLIMAETHRSDYHLKSCHTNSSSYGVGGSGSGALVGLEYENEHNGYASIFSWPVRRRSPMSCDADGDSSSSSSSSNSSSINALTSINCFLDRFCDADVITSFASQSCNYDCCDADEMECPSISTDDPDWVDIPPIQVGRGGINPADKQRNSFADFYVAGRYY